MVCHASVSTLWPSSVGFAGKREGKDPTKDYKGAGAVQANGGKKRKEKGRTENVGEAVSTLFSCSSSSSMAWPH